MSVRLKKSYFARDRSQELEYTSFFDKLYKNFSFLGKAIFAIILAPTIVASSIFSQVTFLMIANALLALGFISHFLHRIYRKEVSASELFLTLATITLFTLLLFHLLPTMPGWGFFATLYFINLFATSITTFFLVRNLIIPPIQSLFNYVAAKLFGLNLKEQLFKPSLLDKDKDVELLQRTLYKLKRIDRLKEPVSDKDVAVLNNRIQLLSSYVNKYQTPLFGFINNGDDIKQREIEVKKIKDGGSLDTSTSFIKEKELRKMQKVEKYKDVLKKWDSKTPSIEELESFFIFSSNATKQDIAGCKDLLITEITRQNTKISTLRACLFTPKKSSFVLKLEEGEDLDGIKTICV